MKLNEFKRLINQTEKMLTHPHTQGLCASFRSASWDFEYCDIGTVQRVLAELFKKDSNKPSRPYYLGRMGSGKPFRACVLRIFEQHCIQFKLYKDF